MRILLTLSLVLFVGSAIWAPRKFRDRRPEIDTSALAVGTPEERAAQAEKEHALGPAILAYREILEKDPKNLDALRGMFRATVRLGAAAPRQPDIADILQQVARQYLAALPAIDPDGSLLQDSLRDWVDVRLHHSWYLARGAISMWLESRGEQAAYDEIRDLMRQGPFWRDYYSYCQRYMPEWAGVARFVDADLVGNNQEARIYAAVTLLTYNRLYLVGEDMMKKHGRLLRDVLIEAKADMQPNIHDNSPGTPGGQTILGLALLRDKDARRILARMRLLDHPYLSRVLENARFWAGLDPWEKADFESRGYEHWYPIDHEMYFRGAMFYYADVLRRARAETDPAKKSKLTADVKRMSVLVETAMYFKMTSVSLLARRTQAALFPKQSEAIHRKMIEQGGVDSVFGAMAMPLEERIPILLPAMSSRQPDISSLAVAGMLRLDAPGPLQLPIESK